MATRTGDEGAPKPDPWMLDDLCESLCADPSRTVMIGDTTHDLGMARSAGTAAIAVTYGAHPEQELVAMAPQVCVHDVRALRAWLLPRVHPVGRERPA